MESYIRYQRFCETHDASTIQDFFNKLITGGWEIIYYSELSRPGGGLSNSPQEANFHITVVAGKKQERDLKSVL